MTKEQSGEPSHSERLRRAPIGTRAPASIGGWWTKTEYGWQSSGGSTFPRPGGDWTGELIPPTPSTNSDEGGR
jgi:hypothetical protein